MSGLYHLEPSALELIVRELTRRGFTVIGPISRGGAIVYDVVTASSLPVGWTDEQEPGHYRVRKDDDPHFFRFAVGPQSLKNFFFPPVATFLTVNRENGDGAAKKDAPSPVPKYAFFGVRPCELAAVAIQDKILTGGAYVDHQYAAIRRNAFFVAVNCVRPGGTCFCASMKTGPAATVGFDIALTEVCQEGAHFFAAETGSDAGAKLIAEIPRRELTEPERAQARTVVERAAKEMKRALETSGLKESLLANLEHPRWEEIGRRCLSCANCTLVCPTCFCTTVEDVADLTGTCAERRRCWDSCFTSDYSYIHGGSIRQSVKSRYRQWMTHKLANWVDQFGTLGCVGCGRCITWCPVGIDITEEAAAIRKSKVTHQSLPSG